MTEDQEELFAKEAEVTSSLSSNRKSDTNSTRKRRTRIGGNASHTTSDASGVERILIKSGERPRTSHTENIPGAQNPFANKENEGYRTTSHTTSVDADMPIHPTQQYVREEENSNRHVRDNNTRPTYPHSPLKRPNRPERRVSDTNRQATYSKRGSDRQHTRSTYEQASATRRGDQRAHPIERKVNMQRQQPQVVKYKEVVADQDESIRLNKYLANAGVCSRRDADKLIEQGQIKVNGKVITNLGTRITRQDEVIYQDKLIETESKVYILLNKPKNCVTTSDDPQSRKTVMDIVKGACSERIYPVGRLDRNTTGVLLITNDGELASKLTHPTYLKKKIYHVWLERPVVIEDMQRIANGIELEDGEIHADAISYVREDDLSQVGIEIHSGRNRIVRRIFEHLGYRVVKLDRVYFAGLTKKNLPRGRWRYLTEQEVNSLRMNIFE